MDIGRKLTVEYFRNPAKDTSKDGINYSGYDIHWPGEGPAATQIERFCEVGTRTILGTGPAPQRALVELYFVPCEEEGSSKPKLPKGMKCRRMYIVKEGDAATMYFRNNMVTDMVFKAEDDQRVKDWVALDSLKPGVKHWFDFFAVVPVAQFVAA